MDIKVGDMLEMRKQHPCGEKVFLVTRTGMDIKIKCTKCSREIMSPRSKIEKSIKKIIK